MSSYPTTALPTSEVWCRRIAFLFVLTFAVSWYVFIVRPSDAKMVRVMECVGERAPTPQLLDACSKSVQP